MSSSSIARRVEAHLEFEGVDISSDVADYLLSMTYTDYEEEKTDDLQISLDDQAFQWLEWLKNPPIGDKDDTGWKVGDEVIANGRPQYTSYGEGTPGIPLTDYKGKVTYLNLKDGVPYPIHVDQKGWFAESQVQKVGGKEDNTTENGAKGAELHAFIIQRNWFSDGRDKVLDCGTFEMDSVDASGPPSTVTLKGTAIPYSSTVRTQEKTKAWEEISLSAIAKEVASANKLKCMYESSYDPYYTRQEQIQQSDVKFLQGLCKEAGISLKATAKALVLFDQAEYEKKDTIRTIKRGSDDIIRYHFSTNFNDTAYTSCRVRYTDPATKETIDYTYTPEGADGSGQVLEINKKTTWAEVEALAKKELRAKNKGEYVAEFNLVGDADLVSGVTVDVKGFGFYDGKYIVSQAVHQVTGGYKTNVDLRKVLEEDY